MPCCKFQQMPFPGSKPARACFVPSKLCLEHAHAFAQCVLQMSNDVRMLLPVLVAIMVAKWVADAATHSLYHGQLHVKVCVASREMCWIAHRHMSAHKRDRRPGCLTSSVFCRLQAIPYLPEDPIASISLDLLPVSRVMKSPVVTFQVRLSCRPMLRSDAASYVSRSASKHVTWSWPLRWQWNLATAGEDANQGSAVGTSQHNPQWLPRGAQHAARRGAQLALPCPSQ